MVDAIFTKVKEAFKFTLKEMLMIGMLSAIFYLTFTTNTTVELMDNRYKEDIYIGAETVLITLQKQEICEPEDILSFLSPKPAGKDSLRKGVTNEEAYARLLETYGDLARNAKIAFSY